MLNPAELFARLVEFLVAALDDAVSPHFRPDGPEVLRLEALQFNLRRVGQQSVHIVCVGGVILASHKLGEGHAILAADHEYFKGICRRRERHIGSSFVTKQHDAAGEYGFLAVSKWVTAQTAVVTEDIRGHAVTVISTYVFVFPFLPP
jgi:hypothetical protein